MPANFTDFLEKKVLDYVLRATAYTPPSSLYVGLLTATATTSTLETGASTGEVTGGSYARQLITFDAASSPGGSTQNSAQVTFTSMPATTVVYAAIWDALTAGNMLVWAQLTASKTLNVGDTFVFPTGSFAISLD